jgi:hypothetical protein
MVGRDVAVPPPTGGSADDGTPSARTGLFPHLPIGTPMPSSFFARRDTGTYRVVLRPRAATGGTAGALSLVVDAPSRRLAAEAAEHAAERAQGGIHRAVSVRIAPRETAPDLIV